MFKSGDVVCLKHEYVNHKNQLPIFGFCLFLKDAGTVEVEGEDFNLALIEVNEGVNSKKTIVDMDNLRLYKTIN